MDNTNSDDDQRTALMTAASTVRGTYHRETSRDNCRKQEKQAPSAERSERISI